MRFPPVTQTAASTSGASAHERLCADLLLADELAQILDDLPRADGAAPRGHIELPARPISRLHAEGTTVLLAEQNARMALSVAQRGYVIETGLVVKSASADALSGDPAVREAYLGGA